MRLEIRLLGFFKVTLEGALVTGFESNKVRALLAYLAAEANRPQRRDHLAGLLWPDWPQKSALNNLRYALSDLRKNIADREAEPPFLIISRESIQFNYESDGLVDVEAFERALSKSSNLSEAVGLYRGEFLEGFSLADSPAFEDWARAKGEFYRRQILKALDALTGQQIQAGSYDDALHNARRSIQIESWHEPAHQQVMRILSLQGQRVDAVAHYERLREILQDELQIEPSVETNQLLKQVRSGELQEAPQDKSAGTFPNNLPAQLTSFIRREKETAQLYNDIKAKKLTPERPETGSFLEGEAAAPLASQGRVAFSAQDSPEVPEKTGVFVGREVELARLSAQLQLAVQGQSQVAFIVGEAGQGKTYLMSEFAYRAQEIHTELVVARGGCNFNTGGGDPFLPFRDILRLLIGDAGRGGTAGAINPENAVRLRNFAPTTLQVLVEAGPELVGTLLPARALASMASGLMPDGEESLGQLWELVRRRMESGEPQEIHQNLVLETYTAMLEALARVQPLLLILDDLHWADQSSINLLAHISRRITKSRVMILGSFRPEDIAYREEDTPNPFTSMINEQKRQSGDIVLDLGATGQSAALEFIQALLDTQPNRLSDDFRQKLVQHTNGNPLFVTETLSDMRERGDLNPDSEGFLVDGPVIHWDALPARIEGVIGQRINRLDPELREMARIASVQGETFIVEVVAQILNVNEQYLVRRFSGELQRNHLVLATRGLQRIGPHRLSSYHYRHNLFQRYLYNSLDEVERAYYHEATGRVLEELYASQVEEIALDLAQHFSAAGIADKAISYFLQAGYRAIHLASNEDAIGHFDRAISLLKTLPDDAGRMRLELGLQSALGQAQRNAGRFTEALGTFQYLAGIASQLGSPDDLARAALAFEEIRYRINLPPELSVRLLEEALQALEVSDSLLRGRVLGYLARALVSSKPLERLREMSQNAIDMALRLNDPITLIELLRVHLTFLQQPKDLSAWMAIADEMLQLAQQIGDESQIFQAHTWRIFYQLELGDIQALDTSIGSAMRLAEKLRQPFYMHVIRVTHAMRTIMAGQFERGEQLAQLALETGQRMQIENADGSFGLQMFTLRREQGRIRELAPVIQLFVTQHPAASTWRPGLALIYSDLGLESEAQALFDQLAGQEFADLTQDALRIGTLAYLAQVCAYLGDTARAAILYRLLSAYAGQTIILGFAVVCLGAATHYLGLLSAAMSRWKEAEAHYQDALEMNARMGAKPWLAHSQFQYAAMLLQRNQMGDHARAMALLDEALVTAEELGMLPLAEKAEALREQSAQSAH